MIIYVHTGDYRSFGLSSDLWNGEVIPVEVPDDFSGGGKTYDPALGAWIPDPPYVATAEDIAQDHESRRSELLTESAVVTADWRAYASINEISDEDRLKLKAWLAYNKAVKATAAGEEWPPVPET